VGRCAVSPGAAAAACCYWWWWWWWHRHPRPKAVGAGQGRVVCELMGVRVMTRHAALLTVSAPYLSGQWLAVQPCAVCTCSGPAALLLPAASHPAADLHLLHQSSFRLCTCATQHVCACVRSLQYGYALWQVILFAWLKTRPCSSGLAATERESVRVLQGPHAATGRPPGCGLTAEVG
jgi:hypothetical protein